MLALVERAVASNPSYARGLYLGGLIRLWAVDPDLAERHARVPMDDRGRASGTQVRIKPSSSVRAQSIAWSIDLPCCVHWATILQMVPCANICAPRLVGAG